MYLSQNLKHLRRQNNRQTQENLAECLDLTRSVISAYEDGRAEPNITNLSKIANFFNVSIELLTNVELSKVNQKELEHKKELEKYASAQNLKVRTHIVSSDNHPLISLIPQKASAGYTNGYADNEFFKDLPNYKLPFLAKNKSYRAFEITGDSMLPLKDKSIVIGEYVQDLNDLKEGQVCVVISKNEGIVLKKVYNRVLKRGTLLLKSSNIAYSPYEIPIDEVLELWKFNAYISRDFPTEYDATEDLKLAFDRMEYEMLDIRMNQMKKSK